MGLKVMQIGCDPKSAVSSYETRKNCEAAGGVESGADSNTEKHAACVFPWWWIVIAAVIVVIVVVKNKNKDKESEN